MQPGGTKYSLVPKEDEDEDADKIDKHVKRKKMMNQILQCKPTRRKQRIQTSKYPRRLEKPPKRNQQQGGKEKKNASERKRGIFKNREFIEQQFSKFRL
ncbi:uncharacterized protein LOC143815868 isoform X2 [Ranitomeya variabilis]|uniref:uncharacterized protein LOC143815868 isoform X2 n=1 Tax=Ranitomeya variabilis TaxID=490064 RepID=UPI0040569C75